MLIFKKIFDQKEDYNKYHKGNQNVTYSFIAPFMPFPVLFIGIRDNNDKKNEEYRCENELARAEHILYFYANLTQYGSNGK